MKKQFILLSLIFFTLCSLFVSSASVQEVFGGIKMLEGYKYKAEKAVDAAAGTIYKPKGMVIEFEAGFSQGYAADKKRMEQFEWYKEQTVNGRTVRIAFIKPNLKTGREPDKPRSPEFGSIMVVTIPLGDDGANAINFWGEVLNLQEATDFLLMILTFDETQ